MLSSRPSIGIIGMGGIGMKHLVNFKRFTSRISLEAVCDRNPERLNDIAKDFKIPKCTTDVEEFFQLPLNAVVICTPNATHYPLTKKALLQGWHVLCEKPFTMNAHEAEELCNIAEERGLITMIAFSYRFIPAFQTLRKLIEKESLGRIYHVRSRYFQSWLVSPLSSFSWRLNAKEAGTGVLGDLGAHVFDMLEFATGMRIKRLIAFTKTFIPWRPDAFSKRQQRVTVDDAVAVLGEMEEGTLFTAEMSRYATGWGNAFSVEVYGERGGLIVEAEKPKDIFACLEPMVEYTGFHTNFASFHCSSETEDHYYIQTEAFVKALEGTRVENLPSFRDGLRCQRIIDASLMSAQKGGEWAKIDREGIVQHE